VHIVLEVAVVAQQRPVVGALRVALAALDHTGRVEVAVAKAAGDARGHLQRGGAGAHLVESGR
jgi:hypothetical protein